MRSKLAFIALSGLAVSAICLGGAFALGGNTVGDAVFDFGGFNLPRCDMSGASGAATQSRTLAWQGDDDRAAVAVPANTHYRAGTGDAVVVTGDPAILSHIRVKDGVVGMDCRGGFNHWGSQRIEVTLPGRHNFREFALLGSGDMSVTGLSQAEVELSLAGSGNIDVEGKTGKMSIDLKGNGNVAAKGQTDDLTVDVKGSGNLRLGDLLARNADVDIKGAGKVEVAPQDALTVDIKGSGSIYLRSEPKKIETSIRGSGRIIHPDGTGQGRPERHARAEGAAIRAAVLQALAEDRNGDRELERARAELKARIRAQVAQELAQEGQL